MGKTTKGFLLSSHPTPVQAGAVSESEENKEGYYYDSDVEEENKENEEEEEANEDVGASRNSKTTAQCPDCDWTGKGLYQHRYLKHGYTAGSKAGRKEKKIEKNRRQKYFCTRETTILKKVSPHLTTAKWTTTTMCMLVWTPHDPVINCACCSKMTWI